MSDLIVSTSPLDPRAQPLVEALIQEYDSRYGNLFDREVAVVELNRYPPEAFAPPHGHFLLLLRGGETIGGGAFKRYDETTAEFKRIWTRQDLRRQGLASIVLRALEDAAQRQGYRRIYLATGSRQPEAVSLYQRRGYTTLFDPEADLAALRRLPFEKILPACAGDSGKRRTSVTA
jgi:GNAT superfamily N-acetyltransferase